MTLLSLLTTVSSADLLRGPENTIHKSIYQSTLGGFCRRIMVFQRDLVRAAEHFLRGARYVFP